MVTNNISARGKGKEGTRTAILLKTCSNLFQNSNAAFGETATKDTATKARKKNRKRDRGNVGR